MLTYLLGDASKELLTTYGGMPARIADQARSSRPSRPQCKDYPSVDWQVAKDGVTHRRHPELRVLHAGLQRDARTRRLGRQVHDEVAGHAGLDMDAEIDALRRRSRPSGTRRAMTDRRRVASLPISE